MITYTDIRCLSDQEFLSHIEGMEKSGGKSITVLVRQDGDIEVLSPLSDDLTVSALIDAAFGIKALWVH